MTWTKTPYRSTILADVPIGYWRLEDVAGSTELADAMASRPLTIVGSPDLGLAPAIYDPRSTAAGFDGLADNAERLAYDAALAAGQYTLEAWVKVTAGSGTVRHIAGTGGASWLRANAADAWELRQRDAGAIERAISYPYTLGAWTHLVGTYDGVTMRLYVNGVERASSPQSYASAGVEAFSIAARSTGAERLTGQLDEVAYYNRALSGPEVLEHHTAGRALLVSETTERFYLRLPEHYRIQDELAASGPNGRPLLRYISLLGDQAGELEALFDRINFVPLDEGGLPGDVSELVDPVKADSAWLPWLAQAVGLSYAPDLSMGELRALLVLGPERYLATIDEMVAVAQATLTGAKTVRITEHPNGDVWRIGVLTKATETPSPAVTLAALLAAKPAHVRLDYVTSNLATFDSVDGQYETFNDLNAAFADFNALAASF